MVYHELFIAQQQNTPNNKSALRERALSGALKARSNGAYEFRMPNILAVLDQLGLATVKGYLPRKNFGSVKERLIDLINMTWQREYDLE